jgi:threonine synthase
MANFQALACLRCGSHYPPTHYSEDCPKCRPTAPSNLVVVYGDGRTAPRARPGPSSDRSLWRFGDLLPVTHAEAITLSEGNTPLHRLGGTAAALGLSHLYAKDETRNPTWSFKDRLACVAVSAARKFGAKTIVSSSSGNAGAAAAAYAAKAGIPCVIFTFKGAAGPMLSQMRAYGARVVQVASKADRWTLMQTAVRTHGWFPTSPFFGPAVGSNPFGIEGYKTLAYEIAESMNWSVPDWCVLPVCYGDALVGMWRGFAEMKAFGWIDRMPRMVAAEVSGSLSHAIARRADALEDLPLATPTLAVSIGATRGTYQAVHIARQSQGRAVVVENEPMLQWQKRLAASDGLFVETSSAGALAAVETLRRDGTIGDRDSVVVLLTASGLKDTGSMENALEPMISVSADLEEAQATLRHLGLFPA